MPEQMKPIRIKRASDYDDTPVVVPLIWEDVDGEEHSEEFKGYPGRISTVTVLELPNISFDGNSVAMFDLFRTVFDEDYDRFHAFVTDPDHAVSAESLVEIARALVEQKIDRPTQPSAP
jgi:hypothetical protein